MNCENCGSELFTGQRFCRTCGRPTADFSQENVPTQAMPTAPRSAVDTAPTSNSPTNSVYTPPGYYQPPAPPAHSYSYPPYAPPKSRSIWGWFLALGGFAFFSLVVMAILFVARNTNHSRTTTIAEPPPVTLSSEGWDVVDNGREASFTKDFILASDGKFTLESTTGDVTIEGWDQPKAEIKIVQRGTRQERIRLRAGASLDRGSLSLRSASGAGPVRVQFVVKLPRKLAEVQIKVQSSDVSLSGLSAPVFINTASGAVDLSDISGAVSVDTQSGAIEVKRVGGDVSANTKSGDISLEDVSGEAKASSLSGDVSMVFDDVMVAKPITLNSKSGHIELEFGPDPNADLKAETLSGAIKVEDGLPLEVSRNVVGQQARGQLGRGGQEVSISTLSGGISIKK